MVCLMNHDPDNLGPTDSDPDCNLIYNKFNSTEHCNMSSLKRLKGGITIAHSNARSIKNRNHFIILLKDAVRDESLMS